MPELCERMYLVLQLISISEVSDVVIVVSRCTLSNIVASSGFILM